MKWGSPEELQLRVQGMLLTADNNEGAPLFSPSRLLLGSPDGQMQLEARGQGGPLRPSLQASLLEL